MPQFNILDQPGVQKTLIARSLLQLYSTSFFLKAAVTQFDNQSAFQQGESVSLMRPRDTGEAEDYDPRNLAGNAASLQDPGYVKVDLNLEKLFTKGFPVFSIDANVSRYTLDYSGSTASSLRLSAEKYLYEKAFRLYPIPATGNYRYGGNAPIQVLWNESDTGNLLPMARQLLVRANAVLRRAEVPDDNRYAALSPDSTGDLFVNSPTDEGYVGMGAGGVGLLANGLPQGAFINRHGFMVGTSTTVKGQDAVGDLSAGSPSVAIASVVNDVSVFLQDDMTSATPLGVVVFTAGAAFTAGSIGVGQIVRIGANGVRAKAYGVVLRVIGNDVYVVPYNSNGQKMAAEQINTATDRLSIAGIATINPVYHREHIAYATRKLIEPSNGSGAIMMSASDAESGLTIQLIKGSYDTNRFRESCRVAVLMGAVPTDHRKAALMLCA